jgi:hypothetical protein
MATNDSPTRDRIIALLDSLPDEALAEVVSFLEFQRTKSANRPTDEPPYRPTPMGGLWRGVTITEADIAEARREMWGRFADDSP